MPSRAMAQILYSIKKHALAFHWLSANYCVHQANNLIQESHATALDKTSMMQSSTMPLMSSVSLIALRKILNSCKVRESQLSICLISMDPLTETSLALVTVS